MKKKLILILLLILIFISGCEYKKNHSYYAEYLWTSFYISIYNETDSKYLEIKEYIDDTLKTFEKLTDREHEYSNVNNVKYIIDHPNEWIEIDEKLFNLIKYAINTSKEIKDSDNKTYFNILVGKLSETYRSLFDSYEKGNTIESIPTFNDNLNFNMNEIELDDDNIAIKIKDNMDIDLGGVTKGYVSDYIANYLEKENISYLINAGTSSIRTNYAYNDTYKVRLTDPNNINGDEFYSLDVSIKDTVSVSGDYQRYFIFNNRIYSHIMDANTKESVITDIRSITVITSSCAYGDILSTSLFMMGKDKAVEYIIANNIKAIIYLNDNTYNTYNI